MARGNVINVRFLADTRQFTAATNQVNAQLGKMQKVMKGFGVATAAYFAAQPVIDFVGQSVTAFAGFEEALNKVNVVFKDNADEIVAWAESNNNAYAMSEAQMLSYVGTLGMILNQSGVTTDATKEMSTELVKLAADLASFADVDVDRAFSALRGAIVGEREQLKNLGIVINETEVKQRALTDGLWDGTGAIDAAAKATATYRIIMDKTVDAQGDMIRTGDSISNVMKKVEAQSEDLKKAFGEGLVGAFGDSDEAGRNLLETMESLEPLMKLLGEGVGSQLEPWGKVGKLISEVSFALETVTGDSEAAEKATTGLKNGLLAAIPGINQFAAAIGFAADAVAYLNREERARQAGASGSPVQTITQELAANDRKLQETQENWDSLKWSVDGTQAAYTRMYGTIPPTKEQVDGLTRSVGGSSKATEKLGKVMTDFGEIMAGDVSTGIRIGTKAVEGAAGDMGRAAGQAFYDYASEYISDVVDYASDFYNQITGGINIGKAFTDQKKYAREYQRAQEDAWDAEKRLQESIAARNGLEKDASQEQKNAADERVRLAAEELDRAKSIAQEKEKFANKSVNDLIKEQLGDAEEWARTFREFAEAGLPPELAEQLFQTFGADGATAAAKQIMGDTGLQQTLKEEYPATKEEIAKTAITMGEDFGDTAGGIFSTKYWDKFLKDTKKLLKTDEFQREWRKAYKKKLKAEATVWITYKYRNSPQDVGRSGSMASPQAVREIQKYESRNSTLWRSRL
jgi:hypothetical protein